jgi:DNA-binding PadR family transcriptional regulator
MFSPTLPGRLGRRATTARRGDVRTASLILLAEEPRNGYQLMQEIEERSGGVWRPSPGSIYPALQQLEDEGLIRSDEIDGRKVLRLTPAGQTFVKERPQDQRPPWEELATGADGQRAIELRSLIREVHIASVLVMRAGNDAQAARARELLAETRRALYAILAEADEE